MEWDQEKAGFLQVALDRDMPGVFRTRGLPNDVEATAIGGVLAIAEVSERISYPNSVGRK